MMSFAVRPFSRPLRIFQTILTRGLALLAMTFALLTSQAMAEQKSVSVTVTYLERIALMPDAILEVELLDVSQADAPATIISQMRFKQNRVPFEVDVPYDPALIDEGRTYVIGARIYAGGKVEFQNTSAYPVLTGGADNAVELILKRATRQDSNSSAQSPSIAGVEWVLSEILGERFVSDDAPTLAFQENGSFSFYGGCNRFSGQATIKGNRIEFPEAIAGTMRACHELVEQLEREVLDALMTSGQFERHANRLLFIRDDGRVGLGFQGKI